MKSLKSFLFENISSEDLIDIIDMNPKNPRNDRYIKMLKDLHNIDYVEPKIRFQKEIKVINKYDNTAFDTKTNKGIEVNVVVEKQPTLDKTLQITVYDEFGNTAGRAGFEIDMNNKSIRIGGAMVEPSMRRKGIYSVIVDFIQKVAKENKLKILDIGRSDDAKAFWKSR